MLVRYKQMPLWFTYYGHAIPGEFALFVILFIWKYLENWEAFEGVQLKSHQLQSIQWTRNSNGDGAIHFRDFEN
jgi:hypothetical protein